MAQPSVLTIPAPAIRAPGTRPGLRERRRARSRAVEQDRAAAQRAEHRLLGALLADAADLVAAGWVQRCWFTVDDDHGRRRRIGAGNLPELPPDAAVAEVCLVGAVVTAGGGVARAGTQSVRRALDLTWATLSGDAVHWCPAPPVRLAHVCDLTRWNDAPQRTADDVRRLLTAASRRIAS